MSDPVMIRERFTQGLTFDEFLSKVKMNREKFSENYKNTQLSPEDEAFFRSLAERKGTPIKALAIAEDWCPDAFRNLPILAKIVDAAKDIELRIFFRDENLDLMEQYLTNGCMSIPVFVFFDQNFDELGRWVERPKEATKFMQEARERLAKPGMTEQQIREATRDTIEAEFRKRLSNETVRELKEVLS